MANNWTSLLLLIVTLFALAQSGSTSDDSIRCKDDEGKPVDWFVVYKFPYIRNSKNKKLFGGYQYAWMSNEHRDGWRYSDKQISDQQSIFANTLSPFFSKSRDSITSVLYSDQPPNDTVTSTYAHAKGVVLSDTKQGVWLIHTIPKFPFANATYEFVSSGGRFGQVALCLSLPYSEILKIVEDNFLVAKAWPYFHHIDSKTKDTDLGKAIDKWVNHKWLYNHRNFSDTQIKTMGGTVLRSFYKSPSDEVDLYADIVAPTVKSGLKVETWRHEPGHVLPSECKKQAFHVENVDDVQLSFVNSDLKGQFNYMDDHSKWAISDASHDLVCLGDINRVQSQFQRGGGTTCLHDEAIWKAWNKLIAKIEECK